jgi:hypothetical protein
MSLLLKKAIAGVNTFVKIEKNILKEEIVLPDFCPVDVYKYPENYKFLPSIVKAVFDELIISSVKLPTRKIYTFKKVYVSWQGIVFRNLSVFPLSMMGANLADEFRAKFLFKQWIGSCTKMSVDKPVALVFDQWSAVNYYHWIIEALPRLLLIKKHYPQTRLLLVDNNLDYIKSSVELFGFQDFKKLVEGEIVFAEMLVMPERMGGYWLQDINLLREVRQLVLQAYKIENIVPFRKVYVSRLKAKMRRVINEYQLYELLEEKGFEIVFFETLSFEEQIRLAAETEILIGMHGANLTNILFMSPTASVIELLNEKNLNLAYFKLSAYCNINYYCLPCQNVGAIPDNNADVVVNVNCLATLLAQVNNDRLQ